MSRYKKIFIGIMIMSWLTTLTLCLLVFGPKISDSDTNTPSSTITLHDVFASVDASNMVFPSISITNYANICEMDYVEPPMRRTREQAIAKIVEMTTTYPKLSVITENVDQYTTEMLTSIAANPEMVHFTTNYLTAEKVVTGGIREDEKPEDYPLFLQWDIRWGYMFYGNTEVMGSSGCGPSCLSMAVYYLTGNTACTPDAVAKYSIENKYYVPGTGTSWTLLDKYPVSQGLTSARISFSEAKIKAELDKGNILICSCRPGDFTSSGHFIVIYGYDENGFKINDPKCIYRSKQTWSYAQIRDDIKMTWSIGK